MDRLSAGPNRVELPVARYRIEPARSKVTFTTRHMFGLLGVRGSFAVESGEIEVTEPVEHSIVRATVDMGSFRTGNPIRDRIVRSRAYLGVANHPRAVFSSTALAEVGEEWAVHGELTVKKVAAKTVLSVESVTLAGKEGRVRAHTRVDRYAFGITGGKGLLSRWLDITLDVVAVVDSSADARSGNKPGR